MTKSIDVLNFYVFGLKRILIFHWSTIVKSRLKD